MMISHSRIQLGPIENKKVVGNPGEVYKLILEYLKNLSENPIQNDSINDPQPSTSR